LLARMHWLNFLRFCGEHSIVIYLAFFLPMASTRTLLLKTGIIHDIGLVSVVVTAFDIDGSLLIWRAALWAHANFLFERPDAFWIAPKKPSATLQAAE
ncbi:MAG: acyltransferase, partial [Bradyrhizobium sp.]|nr:acyltransferase [Bradyrhizobium sp.]